MFPYFRGLYLPTPGTPGGYQADAVFKSQVWSGYMLEWFLVEHYNNEVLLAPKSFDSILTYSTYLLHFIDFSLSDGGKKAKKHSSQETGQHHLQVAMEHQLLIPTLLHSLI